jgi:4-hydroxybenzoyl-CoA reductase subunit beta
VNEVSFIPVRAVSEAIDLLKERPPADAVLMAGGTDLLVRERQELITFRTIIYLRSIPVLSEIRPDGSGGLSIGAMAGLDEVASHPDIRERYPILAQAASTVASPQIRHKATIGGNLCLSSRCWFYNHSPFWRAEYPECRKSSAGDKCYVMPKTRRGCFALQSGDTVGPLVALNAKVKLVSDDGERILKIEDLYLGDGIKYLALGPHEILTEVLLPSPSGAGAFLKFRPQNNLDYATFDLSVILPQDGAGSRIVVSSVASRPLRARKGEKLLDRGGVGIEAIARQAAEELNLVSFVRGSVEFKRRVIEVKLGEALAALVGTSPQD